MSSELDEEKKFYERFYALHRNPMLLEVFEKFGIRVFRRSSVLEGFSDFVQQFGFSGRRCVEIGTCKGLTALVLSRFFEEVVTFDIAPDGEAADIASAMGVHNIRFVRVADNAQKARLIQRLSFDAAYVDGDHARDTESDFALVERCGRVLLHEYWSAQPPVVALVERLKARGDRVLSFGKLALWTV